MNKALDNSKVKLDNAHVLLIDDEEYLVKLWKRVIENKGFRVTSYTSGRQALEAFRDTPDSFDIVITDQSMPEITGFELVEEILKVRSNMKFIICSGYLGDIDFKNEINKQIEVVLLKPFDSNALMAAIESALMKQ